MHLWDIEQKEEITIPFHSQKISGICAAVLTQDGNNICAINYDMKLYFINVFDKTICISQVNQYSQFNHYMLSSPSHSLCLLYSCGLHTNLSSINVDFSFFNLKTGKIALFMPNVLFNISMISFSPDGRFLFGCGDQQAIIWEMPDCKEYRRYQNISSVKNMSINPDNKHFVVIYENGSARMFETVSVVNNWQIVK